MTIPINDANAQGEYTLNLRLRELAANKSKYKVQFFTYDALKNIKYLYCSDWKVTGYKYEFDTLLTVTPNITTPTPEYSDYNNKNYKFTIAIPGTDGVNMGVYYEVYQGTEEQVKNGTAGVPKVSQTLIEPLGNLSTYFYYSSEIDKNKVQSIGFNPGSGPLLANTTYTIKIIVRDAAGGLNPSGEIVGNSYKQFNTIATLAEPSFYISTSSTEESISVTVTTTDIQKSIVDSKIYYALEDKDGNQIGDTVEGDAPTNGARDAVSTHTFSASGRTDKEYRIRAWAYYDAANRNLSSDYVVVQQTDIVNVKSSTSATLGYDGKPSEIVVSGTVLQNFDSVGKIVVTITDNGKLVGAPGKNSKTFTGSEIVITSGSLRLTWNTSEIASDLEVGKQYDIKVQYQTSAGAPLGTQTGLVTIHN